MRQRSVCGCWLPGLSSALALLVATAAAGAPDGARAQEAAAATSGSMARIEATAAIGGVVTGAGGQPEAGVWVIAETNELPTRFIKIVVTDDQGRYLLPDLPQANYSVWVRGYGLVDSPKAHGVPGQQHLALGAVPAPTPAAAAHYYPGIYWYSMMQIPDQSQFGGTGDIPEGVTQVQWLTIMKNQACVGCHQQGQQSTRTLPAPFTHLGSSEEAWMRRVQSGQAASSMVNPLAGTLGGAPFRYLAAYTDAVAAGALPPARPQRPQGVERNVVLTLWGWGSAHTYLHDPISTDKRNPNVNANGPVWGSPEYSTDDLPILDPRTNTASVFRVEPLTPGMPEALGPGHAAELEPAMPSAYWGDRKIWSNRFNNHNSMFDGKGRLWHAATVRGPENPAWCAQETSNPYVRAFPLRQSQRQVAMYDPATRRLVGIDLCFGTHHLQFASDADDTLWFSGGGPVIGWLNTRKYLETGDAKAAQGWIAPAQHTRDPAVRGGSGAYAVMPNPADGSIWASMNTFAGAGGVLRLEPGANPPETAKVEFYKVPLPGFSPRGADIDRNGVVWVSLGSGHLGQFDRRKCKGPLDNGPGPDGVLCPEGWSFHQYPGPGFAGIGENSAEASYWTWVDQHDTLGLGRDVPISTGNENDALLAYVNGAWVTMRVPYPLGFYAKGLDGRIDDPDGGWKGRGVWTTSGDRTPWLMEGGKGNTPLLMHFQVRPNPLAD